MRFERCDERRWVNEYTEVMQDLRYAIVSEHCKVMNLCTEGEEWVGGRRVGGIEGSPGFRDEDLCTLPEENYHFDQ